MGIQKKKNLDAYGADDEDIDDPGQLAAPIKSIEVDRCFSLQISYSPRSNRTNGNSFQPSSKSKDSSNNISIRSIILSIRR